jgi:ketopantoate hydroxymethyltransferase
MKNKFTVSSFLQAKANKEKITMLTAYDYSMAKIVNDAGIWWAIRSAWWSRVMNPLWK